MEGDPANVMSGQMREQRTAKKLYEVLIPSQVVDGEWWQWGTYDSIDEAVMRLHDAGIEVDAIGRLPLIHEYDDEWEEEE